MFASSFAVSELYVNKKQQIKNKTHMCIEALHVHVLNNVCVLVSLLAVTIAVYHCCHYCCYHCCYYCCYHVLLYSFIGPAEGAAVRTMKLQ